MSRTHPGRFHIAIPGPTNIPERILKTLCTFHQKIKETQKFLI